MKKNTPEPVESALTSGKKVEFLVQRIRNQQKQEQQQQEFYQSDSSFDEI